MTRLEKLKDLEAKLKASMDVCEHKELAALARQYRETIREIDEFEGADETDEISEILSGSWEPGADGQDRAKLQPKRRTKSRKTAADRGSDA